MIIPLLWKHLSMLTITICCYGCESVNSLRLCCPLWLPFLSPSKYMGDSTTAKTAKISFCFLDSVQQRAWFYFFPPYIFLFRLTTLPVACIFPFSLTLLIFFFSVLQLFTLTLNGLVMCMRGRANTWWQAGIKPLVNSRWRVKWPVWSKCVRLSPSLPFIVSGTFSQHFYRHEKQFEGLGASALALLQLCPNNNQRGNVLWFNGMVAWWQETCPILNLSPGESTGASRQSDGRQAAGMTEPRDQTRSSPGTGLHSNTATHGAGTGKLTLILCWARSLTGWTQGQERKAEVV